MKQNLLRTTAFYAPENMATTLRIANKPSVYVMHVHKLKRDARRFAVISA